VGIIRCILVVCRAASVPAFSIMFLDLCEGGLVYKMASLGAFLSSSTKMPILCGIFSDPYSMTSHMFSTAVFRFSNARTVLSSFVPYVRKFEMFVSRSELR